MCCNTMLYVLFGILSALRAKYDFKFPFCNAFSAAALRRMVILIIPDQSVPVIPDQSEPPMLIQSEPPMLIQSEPPMLIQSEPPMLIQSEP